MNKTFALVAALIIGIGVAVFALQGSDTPGSGTPIAGGDKLDASETIIERLPKDTLSLVYWDAAHPAYERLASSPWASGGSVFSGLADSVPGAEVITSSGINLFEPSTLSALLKSAALFVAPGADGKMNVGAIVESRDAAQVSEFHTEGYKTLEQSEDTQVEKASLGDIQGYKVTSKVALPDNPGQQTDVSVYVGYKGTLSAWGSTPGVVDTLLSGKNFATPDIMESKKFTKATSDMVNSGATFGFGYLDLASIIGAFSSTLDKPKALNSSSLETVVSAASMTESPVTDVKALYNPQTAPTFVKDLEETKPEPMSRLISGKPLLFLTVDGSLLQTALAASAETPVGAVLQEMQTLNQVGRLGIHIAAAPLGQSMLPIPNFSIVAETSQPQELTTLLKQRFKAGLGGLQSPWQEKEIMGRKAQMKMVALGINAFVVPDKNHVVISNSEVEIENILKALDGEGISFTEKASSNVQQDFTSRPSLGALYIDFREIAGMMKNLGGLLAMFGAQSPEMQQAVSQENISYVEQLGVMTATLRHDASDGEFRLINYYVSE